MPTFQKRVYDDAKSTLFFRSPQCGAVDIGDRYTLLRKRDRSAAYPVGDHAVAIANFLGNGQVVPRIRRWARLLLPNGQIARSRWREALKPLEKTRMSRNVKLQLDGQIRYGEVIYLTRLANLLGADDEWRYTDVVILQLYSLPDEELLEVSSQTVVSCIRLDELTVNNVENIASVVAMIPHKPTLPSGVTEDRFFILEQLGSDISTLGVRDDDNEEDVGGVDVE
ncbi:hypothetical protein BDR03DRAFT_1009314 [Suillus americanus]|nr:hypothetical protein BDR03DRAFT_1009314 [Suillus americanus]